jgi:hypothetical protein
MKAKIFTLIMFLAGFGVAQAQQDVLMISALPEVDGVVDGDVWGADNYLEQLTFKDGATIDASSKFQILHTEDALAVAVVVADATPHNESAISNTYERDCIELFLHMSSEDVDDGTYGTYQDWTWQIRYQRDGDDGPFTDGNRNDALIADADFAWEVVTDDAGWVLETVLPIDLLVNGYADWDGENFKFDIQTADNTTGAAGGRTGQLFWNDNSDDQWRDTKRFAAMVLSDEMLSGIQSVQNQIGSVTVVNDQLQFRNVEGNVSVYSISGALVKKAVIDMNGSMDISSLKSGIYIVKSDKLTAKIIK